MNAHPPSIDEIYLACLEQPTPEERAAYLDEACLGVPAVRERVERLLRAQAQVGSFLESPAPELCPTIQQPAISAAPGNQIGPYKLLQQIGEGGMGIVYVAEQLEPIRRKVALKVIKPGMDTRQVIARFEAEQQALAMMDHPNIAKVLDAGTTGGSTKSQARSTKQIPIPKSQVQNEQREGVSDPRASQLGFISDFSPGRPYFVMELVKGQPITRYCDEHSLTPRQRLELFIPVCQAIQHAHQKGVIHRDLKPSNVLVALYDDHPVPKVIDFGVAKAIGQPLTEETLHTGFGAIVGTIEYMSPEQATFNQLDVDTRSDIYSLGVILYELLTGSPPFARRRGPGNTAVDPRARADQAERQAEHGGHVADARGEPGYRER